MAKRIPFVDYLPSIRYRSHTSGKVTVIAPGVYQTVANRADAEKHAQWLTERYHEAQLNKRRKANVDGQAAQ